MPSSQRCEVVDSAGVEVVVELVEEVEETGSLVDVVEVDESETVGSEDVGEEGSLVVVEVVGSVAQAADVCGPSQAAP